MPGTPGIGKSFFAVVLMSWLVKEQGVTTIVYESQDKRYLFMSEGTDLNVEQGDKTDFGYEIELPTTWWIVDMATATERAANTVLLASPDRTRYKGFLKLQAATTLSMPVWTDNEIEKCRLWQHPNLSASTVQTLVSKWGNIPRYVLEKASDPTAQSSLEDTLSTCRWDDILWCIGEPDTAPYSSHKLVHLELVGNSYTKKIMKLASPYVAREIEAKAGMHHTRLLQNLVQLSIGKPAYAAAAGLFFEMYAHRRLQAGGSFHVRKLNSFNTTQPKGSKPLALQRCDIHEFHKVEEVAQQVNHVYCVPQAHNFLAVDALMQPNILFQMTIAQKSSINLKGLHAAARQLSKKPPRIYFVVPDHLYGAFHFVAGIPQEIEQWVLKVSWM
ncbi:hypothetical protein Vretifemale_14639 [Volvox reticuliferus]|uniref:Uncharacterized protein n=1 Tax=Volvox reticuliferus TaxID=1737510 RepID=A0A8J4CMS3_9CHLO|nr:hypothetical protein Vretifemale_14639 [Volvox reticuliferus]